MANRTVKDASSVKGTNPQYLVEKIIRTRIYECKYWKEECFALTAELLVDKAMELRYVGGIFGGNVKPTPFLCLALKMLQIQPEKDIVIEFIKNVDFKYVRCLGALYMRIVGSSLDCYKYLEPLYLDYRKLRRQNRNGDFEVIHMDEFIDELLREERVCDIIMPRIQKRHVLEETNQLEARISGLDDEMDVESEEEGEDMREGSAGPPSPDRTTAYRDYDRPRRSPSPRFRRSRSPARRGGRRGSRERDHEPRDRSKRSRSRERHHGRDRDRHAERRRSRSRSKDRHRSSHKHKHRDDDDEKESRHRHHKSKKSKRDRESRRDRGSTNMSQEEFEIQQANELRAKLGLAPLK